MSGQKRDCQCLKARHTHGTRRAYDVDRCRCFACRVAHSNAIRTYRNGGTWVEAYLPAAGTQRRLQALAVVGVTTRRVAEHAGMTVEMVTYLRGGGRKFILPGNAARVAAAYDALWDKGGTDADSRRCSTQAAARGYAGPMDWDDDEIDDPAARPHTPEAGSYDLAVCGTPAAARRHYRRGEPLDEACKAASRRERAERRAA